MTSDWAALSRYGGIGDNLIVSSVFPLLQKKYGKLEVLTQEPFSVVLENNPYIDKLTVFKGPLPLDGLNWQHWHKARAEEYAFFANLTHSVECSLALTEVQTQFWWPDAIRRQTCGASYLERTHDICGVEHIYRPQFFPTEAEVEQAEQTKKAMGGRFIAWPIGGTRLDKIHPLADLAIARIIKELNIPICLLGASQRDFDLAKLILTHVKEHNGTHDGLHLAQSQTADPPNWPVRRALAQCLTCDLMITPDTGPAWAVAFEPMPKIVLLSHASERNIIHQWINTISLHADPVRVPCWPCHKLHDRIETCVPNDRHSGSACISDIGVNAIVEAAREALGQPKAAPLDKAERPFAVYGPAFPGNETLLPREG